MKAARAAATGATLLFMTLGIFAMACIATAALIGILWIGAAYSWIALVPVLLILIPVNDALKRKVTEQERKRDRAPPIEGPVAEAFASASLIFPILAMAAGAWALYQTAQLTSWWAVGIIVAIGFGCPWIAQRDAAILKEAASRQVLSNAARYRAAHPGATSRA